MTFAEDAERELTEMMLKNRNGALSNIEKSSKGANIVIKLLDQMDKPTNPKHIAEILDISSARIAVVLGNLEKQELVIRTMDPDDRRKINVRLTDKGKVIARKERDAMKNKIIKVFQMMGEEETKQYLELTAKFIDYSQQIKAEGERDQ